MLYQIFDIEYQISNILMSLKGIITLQKSLFSHTFLCDSGLFFRFKVMKTTQTIKIPIIFLMLLMLIIFLPQDNAIVVLRT